MEAETIGKFQRTTLAAVGGSRVKASVADNWARAVADSRALLAKSEQSHLELHSYLPSDYALNQLDEAGREQRLREALIWNAAYKVGRASGIATYLRRSAMSLRIDAEDGDNRIAAAAERARVELRRANVRYVDATLAAMESLESAGAYPGGPMNVFGDAGKGPKP